MTGAGILVLFLAIVWQPDGNIATKPILEFARQTNTLCRASSRTDRHSAWMTPTPAAIARRAVPETGEHDAPKVEALRRSAWCRSSSLTPVLTQKDPITIRWRSCPPEMPPAKEVPSALPVRPPWWLKRTACRETGTSTCRPSQASYRARPATAAPCRCRAGSRHQRYPGACRRI